MGGVVKKIMKPFVPKAPALPAIPEPAPLPEPPKFEDKEREKKVAEKREKVLRKRKGRQSTILTDASGLEDDDSTIKKKTLLGD